MSQEKQHDFTPRTAGPGVLHGVLQTGSNKLSGLHGRLK